MISCQEISNRVLSALDAENSDRYLFDQDIKPAINTSIEELVTWINQAFSENKLSPENLRELIKVKVWQANSYSRVSFNEAQVGHSMWTLLAIYPKPVVNKMSAMTTGNKTNSVSKFCPDVTFIKSIESAKRLTFEEWNENEDNAFMPGNNVLTGGKIEYGYLDAADYSSTTYTGNSDKSEWSIRPDVSNQYVALAYLKYPTPVASISDSIEFPKSLTSLVVDLCLNRIAFKQGTQNLYTMSAQNINRLVSLIK